MLNIIKWTLLAPIVLFFVLLALANRHTVTIRLDPLAGADSLLPTFDMPLFAVLFTGLLAGIIFGGVGTWMSQRKHRKNARQARASARKWQAEAELLNSERQQQNGTASTSPDKMRALN